MVFASAEIAWEKDLYNYILGPGDQLVVSVWKDEELTKVVTVLPDGKFYFPLIGEVSAGGKTVARLKKEMEKRISNYVHDVVLNINVVQVNSFQRGRPGTEYYSEAGRYDYCSINMSSL